MQNGHLGWGRGGREQVTDWAGGQEASARFFWAPRERVAVLFIDPTDRQARASCSFRSTQGRIFKKLSDLRQLAGEYFSIHHGINSVSRDLGFNLFDPRVGDKQGKPDVCLQRRFNQV